MDIVNFILWLMLYYNGLMAQGWTYDLTTARMVPPKSSPAVIRVDDSRGGVKAQARR